jgi:hypothetical protein
MSHSETASFARLLAVIALFAIAGTPLVAYLWETLNELLAFQFDPQRMLIAAPVLLVFLGLLLLLARVIRRMEPPGRER